MGTLDSGIFPKLDLAVEDKPSITDVISQVMKKYRKPGMGHQPMPLECEREIHRRLNDLLLPTG